MMTHSIIDLLRLLPEYFARHLLLSLTALAIGLSISLPLGVFVARWRRVGAVVLGFAGVIQTVPSLALLALMVPLLGMIGFVPALIALVLYSMLPVLRNTVTGLANVDRSLLDAARGVGMTRFQSLRLVELPVAAPTIIAGIRTATVWVVGIATLATPVGQMTLGNLIFTGLQTQNHTAVVLGCVAAAAMALLLDALIRLIESGAERRRRVPVYAGAGLLGAVLLTGLAPLAVSAANFDPRPTIVVGAKTFTEQHVLAEVLAERMRDAGFRPSTKAGMGSQLLFDALVNGQVDCYVDYTGTIWTNVMKRTDFPPRRQMLVEMKRWLASHYDIVVAGRLGFENTYALALRREEARRLGIKSISDLRSHAPQLKIGGDVEFFGRPEWKSAREAYALDFGQVVGMDQSIVYSACNEGAVDVIAAFSSDGRISAYDMVVLRDDRNALPPYDAVVLHTRRAGRKPEFVAAISTLVNSIDDDLMRRANRLVDVDGRSPADAARFLMASLATPADGAPDVPSKSSLLNANDRPVLGQQAEKPPA